MMAAIRASSQALFVARLPPRTLHAQQQVLVAARAFSSKVAQAPQAKWWCGLLARPTIPNSAQVRGSKDHER